MLNREDLTEELWVDLNKAIMYSKLLGFDLIKKVENDEIKVKANKIKKQTDVNNKGKKALMFLIKAAYDDDYCYLSDTGGTCVFFKPHSAQKIRCMMDISSIKNHPNFSRFETTKKEKENIRETLLKMIMIRH